MASSPAWSQLVTDVSSIQHAARGDSSGSLGVSYSPSCHLRGLHDSPALRVGNKLRVDVERRADAGMPHRRLNIFRVRAGLDRPGCPGGPEAAPVHKAQAELTSGRLHEPSENIVVAHRLPANGQILGSR